MGLAPETLAALNSLTAYTQQQQQQQSSVVPPTREERSPSVGRAQPAPPDRMGQAGQVPDIAAILASLTGQLRPAEVATPPAPMFESAPQHPQQYRPPPTAAAYDDGPDSRPSSVRNEQPQETVAYSDLHTILTQNARVYEANQNLPTYSGGPAQSQYAPQTVYYAAQPHTPTTRSPPRYRYLDEHDSQSQGASPYVQQPSPYSQHPPQHHQYAPAAAAQPAYHHRETPVQYIHLPLDQAHHNAGQYFPYEQPPPLQQQQSKPIYIDEAGRRVELIPIEAAPAPVQYVPHPFDQQQQQAYAQRPPVYGGMPGQPQWGQGFPPPPQQQQPPPPMSHGYLYDERMGSGPRG